MKMLRVFLKPAAERWCDFKIPESATAQTVWPQIVTEGVVTNPWAVVPREQIHHMLVIDVTDAQTTLTVFPGEGKPN